MSGHGRDSMAAETELRLEPCPCCSSSDVALENTVTEACIDCCSCGLKIRRRQGLQGGQACDRTLHSVPRESGEQARATVMTPLPPAPRGERGEG